MHLLIAGDDISNNRTFINRFQVLIVGDAKLVLRPNTSKVHGALSVHTSTFQRKGIAPDTIIGRAADIKFLDSGIFAKFITWSFPELFVVVVVVDLYQLSLHFYFSIQFLNGISSIPKFCTWL